jgi:hypothetical protein
MSDQVEREMKTQAPEIQRGDRLPSFPSEKIIIHLFGRPPAGFWTASYEGPKASGVSGTVVAPCVDPGNSGSLVA